VLSDLASFGVVGTEILDFALQSGIVLGLQGPIYQVSELCSLSQKEFVFGGDGHVVLSDGTGMERTRVDCTAMSIRGEELREGCVSVVGNKGGDDILIAVRNDKEVTHTDGVEVVLPAGARKYTRLRACGTQSMPLCISVHCFSF